MHKVHPLQWKQWEEIRVVAALPRLPLPVPAGGGAAVSTALGRAGDGARPPCELDRLRTPATCVIMVRPLETTICQQK